jgi:hypothetical protein
MYKNFSKLIITTIIFAITLGFAVNANAQSTMPVFYDQSGSQVDMNNLQAGTYYRNNNGTGEIYYYGNNRYYDPSTMTFWEGNTNLTQSFSQGGIYGGGTPVTPGAGTGNVNTVTPGVPNTGAGGEAVLNWSILAASILAILAVTYAATRQRTI